MKKLLALLAATMVVGTTASAELPYWVYPPDQKLELSCDGTFYNFHSDFNYEMNTRITVHLYDNNTPAIFFGDNLLKKSLTKPDNEWEKGYVNANESSINGRIETTTGSIIEITTVNIDRYSGEFSWTNKTYIDNEYWSYAASGKCKTLRKAF